MRHTPWRRLAAAAAVVVLAGYSGWWWLTARALTEVLDHWIAGEQAKGARIAPAAMAVEGYPIAFAIKLNNAALAWQSGFGFSGQRIVLLARPWSPRTFKVVATGGFAFTLPPGSARPALTAAGETLRGTCTFRDSAVPIALALTADTVSASRTGAEGQAGREMNAATVALTESRPETPPTVDTDAAFDISLHIIDLSAQAIEQVPLGPTIADALLHLRLMGPPPETADAPGLKAWRDGGGTIEIAALALSWGTLGLSGDGTIALDAQMQPEGAFTAHLTGFDQTIDALSAAGWIKMSNASLAKLALGIAARPGPDGKPIVDTPLTIQNRRISLGPVKLGEVPELRLD